MVLRLLAFNAEAWLADRLNTYLADNNEYRATLLRKIRVSRPQLPVIITTAYMSIEPQLQLLDVPYSDYIVKPFRLDELGARIDAAL